MFRFCRLKCKQNKMKSRLIFIKNREKRTFRPKTAGMSVKCAVVKVLKVPEIALNHRVHGPLHLAVQHPDDQLAGDANHSAGQVSAHGAVILFGGIEMKMAIELPVHGINGSQQGGDLIAALIVVGL